MVDRIERIKTALAGSDWRAWEATVEDFVELLRDPGAISTSETGELVDRFCDPRMKWEVKQAMAKAAPRLPPMWTARVLALLIKDANQYVRSAAKRAQRQMDQTAIMEDEDRPRMGIAEELVAKAAKIGGDEAAQVINEVLFNAHGLAMAEFAHELATIVQQITTAEKMLVRQISEPEKKRVGGALKDMKASVKILTDFVEDLRWLAKGRELAFAKTNANDVLRAVQSGARVTRGVRLRTPQIKDLQFDAVHERLVRALTNIVNNAVEASPKGGIVVVDAARSTDGLEVVFQITDQGPGISKDDREDIFRMGRSNPVKRDKGHSGLGLYVARKVVVAEHNGLINIDDAPGGGTIFRVRIPIEAPSRRRHGTEQ
jgi:signal transduction histidine kinase